MQFQNCTKTGLTPSTQNFVYSKRHCLRFVLESILRNQRPNFEKTRVKSQLRACVENAGFRRSRICDSISLSLRVHMRWNESHHLIEWLPCRRLWADDCSDASLSFVSGFHQTPWPPTTTSRAPILNDAFSKPHICDCLYCAFPRNHLGAIWETGWGGGVQNGSHQSLSDARHFPIDLRFKLSPAFRIHLHFNRFKNQNIFPQIAAAVLMLAGEQYVPMKREKKIKQDTQGCQKNLFQVINYLLLLLPVQFIMLLKTIAKK